MPLWLVGMMGSGKTAVGRSLAGRIDVPFIDTDLMVEAEADRSIAEIFASEGEAGFRRRESAAIEAAAGVSHAVIATGGGAVLDPENVKTMKASGPVVWLQAIPKVLADRIGDIATRPLLESGDAVEVLSVLLAARHGAYEAAADHVVATDELGVDEAVQMVEEIWIAS